jgi:hypothetical protein
METPNERNTSTAINKIRTRSGKRKKLI